MDAIRLSKLPDAERTVFAALSAFVTLGSERQSVIDTATTFVHRYNDESTAGRIEVPIVTLGGTGPTLAEAMHAFIACVVKAKGDELPVEVRWRRPLDITAERDVDHDATVYRITARCAFITQRHLKQAKAAA